MPPDHPLESQFDSAWPARLWCESHVVLAVSAGPDSVAMLRAAVALKTQSGGHGLLYIAHLNHALRGHEADADEDWLKSLGRKLDLPLEIGRADVAEIAAQHGNGLEAAARAARYEFLQQTAERTGARFVATAHTSDDQAETVLHRIVRGTGLAGLAGIPSSRPLSPSVTLVRPLLGIGRREVLDYLSAIGQDYRTDSSNADPQFTRNRLRVDLLPRLREQYNADVDRALLRLSKQAGEIQQFLDELAAALTTQFVTRCEQTDSVRLEVRPLAEQPPVLVREVCKLAWQDAGWPRQSMGFDEWQQLADLIRKAGASPAVVLPGGIRAQRQRHHLDLQRIGPA